uniref:Uncharacterized protein n=1 Tax=Plectus sambesii TaxID=2011161 RepID=A0A914VLG9_9BILA
MTDRDRSGAARAADGGGVGGELPSQTDVLAQLMAQMQQQKLMMETMQEELAATGSTARPASSTADRPASSAPTRANATLPAAETAADSEAADVQPECERLRDVGYPAQQLLRPLPSRGRQREEASTDTRTD